MNRDLLDLRLRRAFDATTEQRRVVVRAAIDLHDAGRWVEVHGTELGVETIVTSLREAPDEFGLVERWNWWVGALELAHGGFDPFRIRQYRDG